VNVDQIRDVLLQGRTQAQEAAIRSDARGLLVVAGAGSGKTDVIARRIAWMVGVEDVDKSSIVAFTFGEAAAEEMKFRIRRRIGQITPESEDPTLRGMYVGTIHGFCIRRLRELRPDQYHNYEIIDDAARIALILRGGAFYDFLGLNAFRAVVEEEWDTNPGQFGTIDLFLRGYDLLNKYGLLQVELPDSNPPTGFGEREEGDWCREAELLTDLGSDPVSDSFGVSAARYYAYLHCRRFLDFSTSQMELVDLLRKDDEVRQKVRDSISHLVVDEVQDINQVQFDLIRLLVGAQGRFTHVGDHRQAIYGWRGGRVELMGEFLEEVEDLGDDGAVIRLQENFRSTPRIIELANVWSDTIGTDHGLGHPHMNHGRTSRTDLDETHVGIRRFSTHREEAEWIADRVEELVRPETREGARHDTLDGERGLTYADIAILIRSSRDARTYMTVLQERGIPTIFQAGPDLFSQPEILLVTGVLAAMAGIERFYGADWNHKTLRSRVDAVLGVDPEPIRTIRAACQALTDEGIPIEEGLAERLELASNLVRTRLREGEAPDTRDTGRLHSDYLKNFVSTDGNVRRIFPQDLFHGILEEIGAHHWDVSDPGRLQSAFYHLGQLSSLIREIESPGWTSPSDFRNQIITLVQWGAENARTDEAELLVPPNAVTISTIHSAKGLEFAAVFVADVSARRFPSGYARRVSQAPFPRDVVDPSELADNADYDAERRLLYVALTRAERYLFVTAAGNQRSRFFRSLTSQIPGVGGTSFDPDTPGPEGISTRPSEASHELPLATSFSDLRYFLECPHDFYLRKVLGFAPGIDRAIGYGQGIHNLLRSIHTDPGRWAELAEDDEALADALSELADLGLFYLRYTTGDPAKDMRRAALGSVERYVTEYRSELETVDFEPEREFETIVEEEDVLVSGAIDLVRLEDPPRVSVVDFKSGEARSDLPSSLDPELMRLQLKIYGMAAKGELEYEPNLGLVRYLGEEDPEKREMRVRLDEDALSEARSVVGESARAIRARRFHDGPTDVATGGDPTRRCKRCDFLRFCGLPEARRTRAEEAAE